jgi:predicted dehydrogenase
MGSRHILVVGSGSVGKRHLRNLIGLGCRVSAMDPRSDRLAEAASQVSLVHRFTDISEVEPRLAEFDGAVVASPPKFHVEQTAVLAEAGLPVLLEKPLCRSLHEGEMLWGRLSQAQRRRVLLGYTYRWWPPLRDFRERIRSGEVGEPLHVKFMMSAHLADWHPWEAYQDFFMASADLGGGALLDESHFVDLLIWLFGMPASVTAKIERLSSLEIETDDNVDILATYESKLRAYIHLDLFGRPHQKYISVAGDRGTLEWSFEPNRVRSSGHSEQQWTDTPYTLERNAMFVGVAEEFLDVVEGRSQPTCTLDDGIDVLRVLDACRMSSFENAAVDLRTPNARSQAA